MKVPEVSIKRNQTDYYKYSGELFGLDIVGKPTIEDGVVSNFTSANYINIQANYFITTDGSKANFTCVMRIKPGTSSGKNHGQPLMGEAASTKYYGCILGLNADNAPVLSMTNDKRDGWRLNLTAPEKLIAGKWYYIKLVYNKNKGYFVYVSEKEDTNEDYKLVISTTTTSYTSIAWRRIGYGYDAGSKVQARYFGAIDFKRSYIKINNDTMYMWRGTKSVLSDDSDYDYKVVYNKRYACLEK